MPRPALLGRAAAGRPPAPADASTERLPARRMGALEAALMAELLGAFAGLRSPDIVLLKPGRRLCWPVVPLSAVSDARMRVTCLLSDAAAADAEWAEWRSRRAALMPLPLLLLAAAAAAAAARSAGFGVLLRCAAAALSVCCVKRDCAFSALLMRGADALLNTC